MAGKVGHLAALLVQPHPAAALLHIEVFNLHSGGCTDAGEGVAHQADQSAIAQPEQGSGVDRGQQRVHLLDREHGGLALANAVFRSPYRMGRVAFHDGSGHQPVEEHPDRGQVLFDGGLRVGAAELLDIRRNVHRRHLGQIHQTFLVTPGGEAMYGFEVGAAGVRVAARYRRHAFPDAFENRFNKVKERFLNALKGSSNHIRAVLFDLDEEQIIDPANLDDPYVLDIYLLYTSEPNSQESLKIANATRALLLDAFKKTYAPRGVWQSIELRLCDVISDQAFTYAQYLMFKEWRTEDMSLLSDPPGPMTEEADG
jgi:hypothetical protein